MSAAALWALVLVTWRERLSRPWFGTICLAICASYVVIAVGQETLQDPIFILTLMIGGGSIGRDVSSGVLPLLFTRPLRRGGYVLAKWLALSSAVAALGALTLVIQAAWLAHRGIGVPGVEVAADVFKGVSEAFGLTAVLLPLSVLVAGYSDVMLWIGIGLIPTLSRKLISQRVADEWQMFLRPTLDWGTTFGAAPIGWFRVFSYFSTVTLCLCLAVVAANRKELSYASG